MQIFKNKITWMDMVSPSEEELKEIKEKYQIHPLILEELKVPSARAKAEIYDHYIFLVLHFPNWNPVTETSEPFELDVVLGKDFIITASFQQQVEMRQELFEKVAYVDFEKKYLDESPIELFSFIVNNFLDFTMRQVCHIDQKIGKISSQLFSGSEMKLIKEIAHIKRDVLDFRRIYRWLKEILDSLCRIGPRMFGEKSKVYFDDLAGESLKVEHTIESFADTIESLEATNNSLIENHINVLTRTYTIISFITWPTLLVIGTFQMNAVNIPITGLPYDYFIMIALAFIPSIILYLTLKSKKLF
ncbi:MAG: hypothetical protein NTW73_01890 [Candidatus Parcubacteria bacterium]|nr:hypothetical protein [Candidatus Parcubacteria bacterium]